MTFSTAHIALTAAISGLLALAAGLWRLPRSARADTLAVALLTGAAVFLWRLSANMPALNNDGLPYFSANDWAAPILTYLFLSSYADLRTPEHPVRYRQTQALATLTALTVNVINI